MKLVSLLSGGIDSPVASYIMSKAGADVILLHMDNGSYADPKEIEKVKLLAEKLLLLGSASDESQESPGSHGQ